MRRGLAGPRPRPAPLTGVGLAGLRRLIAATDVLLEADALVVAGPGGGFASVVGGLTAAPIVAVPTSVGIDATALPAMLASYASGLTIVGLDDGFSAACAVIRLLGPSEIETVAFTPRPSRFCTGELGSGAAHIAGSVVQVERPRRRGYVRPLALNDLHRRVVEDVCMRVRLGLPMHPARVLPVEGSTCSMQCGACSRQIEPCWLHLAA